LPKIISLFACEAQPIVLEGLLRVFHGSERIKLVGSSASQAGAMPDILALRPELVLTDHAAGLKATFQLASEIRIFSPGTRVILWVAELSEADCLRALQVGICGVIKKTMSVSALFDCLESVAGGQLWLGHAIVGGVPEIMNRKYAPRLTPREHDILNLICKGLKNKEIASCLAITAGTVKVHLMHIFEKTGVKDRFELAVQSRTMQRSFPEAEPVESLEMAGSSTKAN
jgi:DNA-binding NarL/FixJ family response regulator